MTKLEAVIGDYQQFLQTIIGKVESAGFDLNDFVQLDHMCYRTISEENYQVKKAAMQEVATQLHETNVNGRLIATFRLREPVRVAGWRVDTVELPAPKEGKPFKEGLEHVEFVLYDDKEAFLKKYADKEFNLASADRGINPEIGFALDEGMNVKFHLLNLPTVVYLEKKLRITEVK